MIRPFHLRDLALVRRLSEQGVSLHTESALTNHVHPLRGALFNLFVGGDYPTYVWKAEKGEATGFIQLHLEEASHRGHILYISATTPSNGGEEIGECVVNEEVWLSLLDQAVIEVGQRGIHSLVAEVREAGVELPVLRRAGFAIYTRQDIWTLDKVEEIPEKRGAKILQPRGSVDDWDIQLLYANIVPRLVQLVEPMPPLETGSGWVLREGDELTAFVHITEGEVATWLRLFIHPNAEAQAEDIVKMTLSLRSPALSQPVFCCVPRYQSWVQRALERSAFVLYGSQAVMVKHTVHHLRKPLPEVATILEPQGVSASTPIVQRYYQPEMNGKVNGH